jgi:hypothetical protein
MGMGTMKAKRCYHKPVFASQSLRVAVTPPAKSWP